MDKDTSRRVSAALAAWVTVRASQAEQAAANGRAQQGRRSSVTGGKHLDGICELVKDELFASGARQLSFLTNRSATLAGYYRASKSWDLLVLQNESPVLAVEFKSMSGSEGKNLNNRADEVFGMAEDARQAEANGLLPPKLRRAYIFVMGINEASTRPVKIDSKVHGTVDAAFKDASYLYRMAIMLKRMRESGLFHLTWAVGVHEESLTWEEPLIDVGWERFSSDLHAAFPRGRAKDAPHP